MIVSQILEGVLGGGKGGGGILSESKEAIFGGCFGLLMSIVFFFFFFASGLAYLFKVNDFQYQLSAGTIPLILALGASGVLSPFVGVMFGLQGGRYSATRHFGCFVIYTAMILAAIAAVVVVL